MRLFKREPPQPSLRPVSKPLVRDFYRSANISLLVDLYFFIKRNCKTRLACMLGAALVALIQPLAILGASDVASAQTPQVPSYLKQVPQIAPIEPTSLSEVAEVPPYVPPPPKYYPPGTFANSYDFGNCTALAASMVRVPETLGNANTWAVRAAALGYTVSNLPVPGAVAQTSRGLYGHVAVVEEVSGPQVKIIEANVLGLNVIDERWVSASDFVYIYF